MPLRGKKGQIWEGGTRNNAVVWGNLVPEAVRRTYSRGLVHVTDWHATFAALGGATLKGKADLDGLNVWDALSMNLEPLGLSF